MEHTTKDGKEITTKDIISMLSKRIKTDEELAWWFHCNIAMTAFEAGTEYKMANDGAARFMKLAFDVDTTKYNAYLEIMKGL